MPCLGMKAVTLTTEGAMMQEYISTRLDDPMSSFFRTMLDDYSMILKVKGEGIHPEF